jgi:hypothetical protein
MELSFNLVGCVAILLILLRYSVGLNEFLCVVMFVECSVGWNRLSLIRLRLLEPLDLLCTFVRDSLMTSLRKFWNCYDGFVYYLTSRKGDYSSYMISLPYL